MIMVTRWTSIRWIEQEKNRKIGSTWGTHTRRGSEVASRPSTIWVLGKDGGVINKRIGALVSSKVTVHIPHIKVRNDASHYPAIPSTTPPPSFLPHRSLWNQLPTCVRSVTLVEKPACALHPMQSTILALHRHTPLAPLEHAASSAGRTGFRTNGTPVKL